jgi:hypothetical protein
MANAKRHAVTVRLTEDHLRKMIDQHLITREEICDRVKVARAVQKLLGGALGLPDKPCTIGTTALRDLNNHCSDMRFGGRQN